MSKLTQRPPRAIPSDSQTTHEDHKDDTKRIQIFRESDNSIDLYFTDDEENIYHVYNITPKPMNKTTAIRAATASKSNATSSTTVVLLS